jgi:N-acetylmuramoyl-L-alanine amidase
MTSARIERVGGTVAGAIVLAVGLTVGIVVLVSTGWYRGSADVSGVPGGALRCKTIVVDPGHGGLTTGAVGACGLIEAEVNRDVARRLRDLLEKSGARVVMTAENSAGSDVDLNSRSRIANRAAPDLFVSIHHNSAGPIAFINLLSNRAEIHHNETASAATAALALARRLHSMLGLPGVRGYRGYQVLAYTNAPAVLVEASYISNAFQEKLLACPDKQELEAEAIFLGVVDYLTTSAPPK